MQFSVKSVTDLTGHQFFRTVMEDGGRSIKRDLTVDQLVKILTGSTVDERQYVLLKDNFFPKEARATWFSDYNNYSCVFEVPAKTRLLMLKTPLGNKHYHVPFPRLIFKVTVKGGTVTEKFCYAMKKGSNKLYHYPFGNVAKGGSICMGNISAKDMKRVSDFTDAFFSGITNNDYYGSDGNGKVSVKFSQEQLLEKLSSGKSFPDSFLVEDMGRTIKGLCEYAPRN